MSASPAKPALSGRFITFEGIDGCGKTTQARRLAERLRKNGLPLLETREPGGTPIGVQLRAVLLNPDHAELTPECELLLYLADRLQHLEQVVRPALARGEVVICDRFHDATVAYQHHGRGLDLQPLREWILGRVLTTSPDLTFWLDLDVQTARSRMEARNREGRNRKDRNLTGESRLDSAEEAFHQRVREGYASIHAAEPERVTRIDAAASPDAMESEILAILRVRFHAE